MPHGGVAQVTDNWCAGGVVPVGVAVFYCLNCDEKERERENKNQFKKTSLLSTKLIVIVIIVIFFFLCQICNHYPG